MGKTPQWRRPDRHSQVYKKFFKPAVKQALPHLADYKNRRGLRWHDLRHTCAGIALSSTANLYLVMKLLGHDDIKTTINTYGHLLPSADESLAAAMGAVWEADNVVALRKAS